MPLRRLCLVIVASLSVHVQAASAWTWPVDGPVLRPFVLGDDPYAGGQHRGVDVGASEAGDVAAPAAGTVSFAGTVPQGGRTVTIQTADGYSVTLLHLGPVAVRRGDAVVEGATVATIGPSGVIEWNTPYVHLGVRVTDDPNGYLDPLLFLPPRSDAPTVADETAPPTGVEATPVAPAPVAVASPVESDPTTPEPTVDIPTSGEPTFGDPPLADTLPAAEPAPVEASPSPAPTAEDVSGTEPAAMDAPEADVTLVGSPAAEPTAVETSPPAEPTTLQPPADGRPVSAEPVQAPAVPAVAPVRPPIRIRPVRPPALEPVPTVPGAPQADAPVQPASAASVAAQREPDSASLTSAAPAADAAPAVDGSEDTAADPVGEAPTATPAVSSARSTRDLIGAAAVAAVAAETRGRLFEESGGGPLSPLGRWRIGGPTPSAPPYEAGRRAHFSARTATVSGDAPGVAPLHVAEVVRVIVARPSAAVRVRAPHRAVELPAHRDAIRWPPFARVAAPIALVATLVTAWLGRRRRRIAAVPPAPTRFSAARCSWQRVEPSRSRCRAAPGVDDVLTALLRPPRSRPGPSRPVAGRSGRALVAARRRRAAVARQRAS